MGVKLGHLKNNESAIQSSEIKFLHSMKEYSQMNKIRNKDIRKELKIIPILVKIKNYRTQWKEHLEPMDRNHIPKAVMKYKPKGKRNRGRP